MSANFIVSAPPRTKQSANGQTERLNGKLKDEANEEGTDDLKPIASEVSS
jgi:hypothetical protein